MSSKQILELNKVTFSYGCHTVLEDISLTINAGDAVGITGPNGAGKSTLLKLILGLLKPTSGAIKLFGVPAHKCTGRMRIGYVPQKATAFNQGFPTTVLETVAAGRIAKRGLLKPLNNEDYRLAEEALRLVGLYQLKNNRLSTLSGGQQQRVFIARAIVSKPDLLILDEPTVGVDVQNQALIIELLQNLNKKHGLTIIIVSHELELIKNLINRQVCLDKKICHCSCHTGDKNSLKNIICSKSVEESFAIN